MTEPQDLANFTKRSPFAKAIKAKVWLSLSIVLIAGLATVIALPHLDLALTGGDRPGVISFVGTGVVISLLTIFVFSTSLKQRLGGKNAILFYAIMYNILIIAVKFTLAPASLYQANPTLVVDEGGFSINNNFNGNLGVLALMAFAIFLLYFLVFTLLKRLTIRGVNKKFGIRSKPARKAIPVATLLIVVGLSVFTGGFALFIPFIFASLFLGSSVPYLGYIFSTGYAVVIALCLMAAIGCAGAMFIETERQTVLQRNLPLLVAVIWTGMGLLIIYHILWAVYLFVLTTLWPFKVVTVSSK